MFPISKIIETHSHFLHLSASAVQAVKPIRIVPGHSRSGHKTQTKKEYLSLRKSLRVLFSFVPAWHVSFSFKRKRNGAQYSSITREDQTRFTMRINRDCWNKSKQRQKRTSALQQQKLNKTSSGFRNESRFFQVKKQFSHPVSGSGASGKTSPHSTKVLPSGHRARTKKEQPSSRKPPKRSFSLYGRGTFFSLAREKEMWGANVPPLFQEEKKPRPVVGRNRPPLPRGPPPPGAKGKGQAPSLPHTPRSGRAAAPPACGKSKPPREPPALPVSGCPSPRKSRGRCALRAVAISTSLSPT